MSPARSARSFCRICQGFCAVDVQVADGKILAVRGDKSDPLTRGYACPKGLQAPEQHHGPGRLLHSLRRARGGILEAVAADAALDEIAGRLNDLVGAHGPQSVALFLGTQALFNSLSPPFVYAFAEALGTLRLFGTMTIDQSAKWVAEGRLGRFEAGGQPFADSDVWMLFGSNPLVSVSGGPGLSGFAAHNPAKSLRDAKARGLKLIVIDPRRTETARFADLHLQPRPGQDAALAAGLLSLVLENGWHDAAFCQRHVEGLEQLRKAVAPFTPAEVAARADIGEADLRTAARMFSKDAAEAWRDRAPGRTWPRIPTWPNISSVRSTWSAGATSGKAKRPPTRGCWVPSASGVLSRWRRTASGSAAPARSCTASGECAGR